MVKTVFFEIIRYEGWLDTTKLLILDELYKMPGWKFAGGSTIWVFAD